MINLILLEKFVLALLTILPLVVAIAFYTVTERKIIAAVQRRRGPNVVGPWGLLQAFADGLKLLIKEVILPHKANIILFVLAPLFILSISLVNWSFIPFSNFEIISDFKFGILGLLALSSLSVYGIIFAGWSSNSRYPFIGAIRSAAQIISYELSLTFIILTVLLFVNSLNLIEITNFQTIPFGILFPPLFLIFILTILAETNRAPFDLPEAEAEIVAGYNLEYSSIPFALFFLGEYSNIILISTITTILFFGGWVFIVNKILLVAFAYALVRATLPRLRYDQLMYIGWKIFLPILFGYFIITIGLLISFTNYNLQLDHLFFPFIFFLWEKQQHLKKTNLVSNTQQCNTHMVFFFIGLLTQIGLAIKSLFIWLYECILSILNTIGNSLLTILKTLYGYCYYVIDQFATGLIYLGGYFIIGGLHLIGTAVLIFEIIINKIPILADQLAASLIYLGGYFIIGGLHLIGTAVLTLAIVAEKSLRSIIILFQTNATALILLKCYIGFAIFAYTLVFVLYCIRVAPTVRDYGELTWHFLSDSRTTKRSWKWFKVWFPIQCKRYTPHFIQHRWYAHFNSLYELKKLNYESGFEFDYKVVRFCVIITHVIPLYVGYQTLKYAIFIHFGWTGFIGASLAYTLAFLLTSIHPSICPDYLFIVIVDYVNFHIKDTQLSNTLIESIHYFVSENIREAVYRTSQLTAKLIENLTRMTNMGLGVDNLWGSVKATQVPRGEVISEWIWRWHRPHNKIEAGEIYLNGFKEYTLRFRRSDHILSVFTNRYAESLALLYAAGKAATATGTKNFAATLLVTKITVLTTNIIAAKLAVILKILTGAKLLGIHIISLYQLTIAHAWKCSRITDFNLPFFLWYEFYNTAQEFFLRQAHSPNTESYITQAVIDHMTNKLPATAGKEDQEALRTLLQNYTNVLPNLSDKIIKVCKIDVSNVKLIKKVITKGRICVIPHLIPASLFFFLVIKHNRTSPGLLRQKKNFPLKKRHISFGKTKLGRTTRRLKWYYRKIIALIKESVPILITYVWFITFLIITFNCFLIIILKGYSCIDLGLYPYNFRPPFHSHTLLIPFIAHATISTDWLAMVPVPQLQSALNIISTSSYDNIYLSHIDQMSRLPPNQFKATLNVLNISSYNSAFNNYACSNNCPHSVITYRIFTESFPCRHPNCYFPFVHGHREHWTFSSHYSALYYIIIPCIAFGVNWIRFSNKRASLPDDVDIEFPFESHLVNAGLFIWHGLLAIQALYIGDYMWIADPHVPILQYMLLDNNGNDLCAHCLRPVFDRQIHKLKFLVMGPSIQSAILLLLSCPKNKFVEKDETNL